jgi:hypothetical protein
MPGRVFIFIAPVENLPDRPLPHSLEELVSRPPSRRGETVITAVELPGDKSSGTKKCLVARSLWKPVDVWDEVYGIQIDSKLFRAWVQYENEPLKIRNYRSTVIRILSSLSRRKVGEP